MNSQLPKLSHAQWAFLAFLEACDMPVDIDLAGSVCPVLPGEFLELQSWCDQRGYFRKSSNTKLKLPEADCGEASSWTEKSTLLNYSTAPQQAAGNALACMFSLTPDLPLALRDKLTGINTPGQISAYVDRMELLDSKGRDGRAVMVNLLSRCGRDRDAARLEHDLARQAIGESDNEAAKVWLKRSLSRLAGHAGDRETNTLFISNALLLSTIGTDLEVSSQVMDEAETRATEMGDRRSVVLINLHRGRLLHLSRKRSEALSVLSKSLAEAARLDDADLEAQSAEFSGIYHFIKGQYAEALLRLEKAREACENDFQKGRPLSLTAMIYLGYSAAYIGQFQRSVGTFDYYWRLSRERSDRPLACIMRAALGTVLLMIRKNSEASFHLKQALKEAENTQTAMGIYLSRGGLSYLHYLEGREQKAHELMVETMSRAIESGIIRHYSSPFILEMLFAFDQLGYEPIQDFSFKTELEDIGREPNVHLRGVALRLQTKQGVTEGRDENLLRSLLKQSEDYLKLSGDPIELAKTRLEMARLSLGHGDLPQARFLARQARQGLSGYMEEFFPDDLRNLLETRPAAPDYAAERDYLFQRFLDLMDELVPHSDLEYILTRIVTATNRFFGAERGGLFWFDVHQGGRARLRSSCNLAGNEIKDKSFQSNLALVKKTFRSNQPLVVRMEQHQGEPHEPRAILCIPVEIQGRVRGVLYHDNSYVCDCFDDIDSHQLIQLTRHLSNQVDKILAYGRQAEEKNRLILKESIALEHPEGTEFLTRNQRMAQVLGQADLMAASQAPVLILGETGVGKELLARRLHEMSPRSKHPFVIVDATTIPENLVESELFGYEKGAFTGADHRKLGRLELAHRGTLFIDEMGELSPASQTKMLRALQEKTFSRLGGNKTLTADFWLIAATNRDLAEEVAAGRFRRDLYYRVNVMPLTIPPLKDRQEDIIMLAEHFMSFFAKKHNRPIPKLNIRDKDKLMAYRWPGNVRELKNVMERSVILSEGGRLELALVNGLLSDLNHPFADRPSMDELQRRYIGYLLEKTRGKVGDTAELLGMKRTTLYHRMKKLGLNRTDFEKQ